MKYMGSKARGMNAICEVSGNRLANDKNYHLIEMWKWIVKSFIVMQEIFIMGEKKTL